MKILVIGNGGREHALVWKIAQDASRPELYCAPGNAGTAAIATNLPIGAEEVPALVAWAKEHRPDLVVVGPEAPLCLGVTDALEAEGIKVFGPCEAAARLEGSKAFSKEVMEAAGVPTARFRVYTDSETAIEELDTFGFPVVIKADGLAAGKGVVIAQTQAEAEAAIRDMLDGGRFGAAGAEIVVEEFLDGEEASVFALCDGEHVVLLPAAQDHKRVFDHDEGPNTGGMGAYTPAPIATYDVMRFTKESIVLPVLRELKSRGIVYKGVLFCGLMIGRKGVNVLEFNCRFGDPETEVVVPSIASDIVPILMACAEGTLRDELVALRTEAAATVVMASPGYPGSYPKGAEITGLDAAAQTGCLVFHAGTALKEGRVVTSGGRVLTVTAFGKDLREAVTQAYEGVQKIRFDGAHYRHDIAAKAFKYL
ncbi:MAG: phosphoribosylamine--glycine ligase [Kiritimatiellae bacterium]|nr:phosphoribosylamine--glycine ligase [Kiritimatiellia bacterium]